LTVVFRKRASSGHQQPPPPADPVGVLDRSVVPGRLLGLVDAAIDGERRWHRVVGAVQPGPLAERLEALGQQVVAGVLELYAVAVRVGEIEGVLAALDPDDATAAYKAAKRRATDGAPVPELDALEARFSSVQRLLNVVADAEQQLQLLDARLLAAVARGAELAVTADPRGLTTMGADLESVVGELGALRTSLVTLGSP
jgi:hypothetical protein